jgi:hypothetical protein
VGQQCSANCFQNKKYSESNEIQSLKEKLEIAINERLLTVPARIRVKTQKVCLKPKLDFF